MSKLNILLLAALLATTTLIGCIGQDSDDLDEQDLPGVGDGDHGTAMVYQAGSQDGDARPVDASALPDGVPLPAGLGHLTEEPVFEPTIGVTSSGNLFMTNIGGGDLPSQLSTIIRSTDQGQTWEDITPELAPMVSGPPNTNDPYLYVDEATDRIYNLDMQGLACNWIKWSDDEGETWTHNPAGCGLPPVLDHPTLFAGPPNDAPTVGYENVVYLCVNRVADSACATSLDGGMTWAGFNPVFPGVNTEGELCGGLHAHGVVGPDGTAYLPKGQCGTPMVAMSQDDGLTWETVTISEDVASPGHEVAFATDDEGNAYAFWMSDDEQPYLAVSTDGGSTWDDPMKVAPPGLTIARFPTVAATGDGGVAVAYVGTTSTEDQADMDADDTWNAYITTTLDATAEDPVFTTVTVNDPADPIARGPCQGRCTPPSGGALGDFIDIVIDDDGRPWAAFVDACTEDCAKEDGEEIDRGLGLVGTFQQGPSLDGGALPALGQGSAQESGDETDGPVLDEVGLPSAG